MVPLAYESLNDAASGEECHIATSMKGLFSHNYPSYRSINLQRLNTDEVDICFVKIKSHLFLMI